MASNASTGDPAEGAEFDYASDDVERPGLVADLSSLVEGDVRFDTYSRQLYATDASAYEQTPIGVVFPTSTDDVAAVMTYCADRDIPVLPRGGGTSLAGQAVNEAVVLDFTRHMDAVREVDPDGLTATAQAGVRLGNFNAELAPHGLKFAPDPAAGDRSALGGAIGNNSTGSHSLVYGKTDAYIESCEAVLADGTVTTFGEIELRTLRAEADADADDPVPRIYAAVRRIIDEEADEIERQFPDLKRNVSGYNLDMLVAEARAAPRAAEEESGEAARAAPRAAKDESGEAARAAPRAAEDESGDVSPEGASVNLARLLAGSEGTLAIVTEATVSLVEVPATKSLALLTYESLEDAVRDVAPALEHEPAALELVDDTLLDLARDTTEFADVVGMLPGGTDSVLLVEFYADTAREGRQMVADLVADRVPGAETQEPPSDGAAGTTADPVRATTAMEAYDAEEQQRFWKLRKAGMPILMGRTGDDKHISFIEDCGVPPENLPEYVADFQEVLESHDTFASFYAHAGPGVLHVRPLVNVKTIAGLEEMEAIADAATDLVVKYGGSVSGEHGDGRARTQWNRKLYGDHLWQVFRDLKSAYDPGWLLNPGTVCGDHNMTEHLRFGPEYAFDAGFDASLHWANENGFQGMVELCHGCGGCRGAQETTGGVMCPTYRAADEEIQATRGRANLLRQAMSGDLPEGELFDDEFVEEVLDLCIGCKGCAKDCPSEVDMAKLKVEVTNEYHRRNGASLREKLFADIHRLSKLGSALAPVSNWASALPGARPLMEKTVGIAAGRTLPTFHRESLRDWFDARGGSQVAEADVDRRALLFPDTHTAYNRPDIGRAAVEVLEAAGVHVALPDVEGSGRPPYSKGFVEKSRAIAERNVAALAPQVRDGWDVVVVEPSDAVMLQSDYLDLLGGGESADSGEESGADVDVGAVETLAAGTYGVLEYLDTFRLDETLAVDPPGEALTYHGHCHQKATKKDHHAVGVLRRVGYAVDPLDSGCCGMAGSFGYEAEHFAMSTAIARILFDQVDASDGDVVVAPGASCRTQLGDREGRGGEEPPHPIEKVAEALR